MRTSESLGDTLRDALPVPTDTMITLDLPMLLTRLSQVPAIQPIPHRDALPIEELRASAE